MNHAVRCLIAVALLGAAQAFIWQVKARDSASAMKAAEFEIDDFPTRFGDWIADAAPPDADVFRDIGALKMIERTYVNPAGYRLAVVIATFPSGRAILPHPPNLCYAGTGWTILSEEWQADRRDRPYKLLVGERNQQKVLVSFWYQLHQDVVSTRDELRSSMQRIRWNGRPWPPMVKVLIHAPVGFSEADAKAASEEVGAAIHDWILQHCPVTEA